MRSFGVFAVLLVLAVFVCTIHADDEEIGAGWTIRSDGKGFQLHIKNSVFSVETTCLKEMNEETLIAEANLDDADVVFGQESNENFTTTYQNLTIPVSGRDPAFWRWVVKFFHKTTSLQTIDGDDDNVITLQPNDVKANTIFEWPQNPLNILRGGVSNHLEWCLKVSWDISPKDIASHLVDGIPTVDANTVKNSDDDVIGVEITGAINFKVYFPGRIRYSGGVDGSEPQWGNMDFNMGEIDAGLEGSTDIVIKTEVWNRVEIDPVLSAESSGSALRPALFLLFGVLLALFLLF